MRMGIFSCRHCFNHSTIGLPLIRKNINRAKEMLGFLFLLLPLSNHIITSEENLPGNTKSLSLYKFESRENNKANSRR